MKQKKVFSFWDNFFVSVEHETQLRVSLNHQMSNVHPIWILRGLMDNLLKPSIYWSNIYLEPTPTRHELAGSDLVGHRGLLPPPVNAVTASSRSGHNIQVESRADLDPIFCFVLINHVPHFLLLYSECGKRINLNILILIFGFLRIF